MLCPGSAREETKKTNLLQEAGETAASPDKKSTVPQTIKGTGWGHGRSKATAANSAARVQNQKKETGMTKEEEGKPCQREKEGTAESGRQRMRGCHCQPSWGRGRFKGC